jgi:hypothetical protein
MSVWFYKARKNPSFFLKENEVLAGVGENEIDPSLFPHEGCTIVALRSKAEDVKHVPLQLLGVAVPSVHVFPPSVDRSYDCPVTVAWKNRSC